MATSLERQLHAGKSAGNPDGQVNEKHGRQREAHQSAHACRQHADRQQRQQVIDSGERMKCAGNKTRARVVTGMGKGGRRHRGQAGRGQADDGA